MLVRGGKGGHAEVVGGAQMPVGALEGGHPELLVRGGEGPPRCSSGRARTTCTADERACALVWAATLSC